MFDILFVDDSASDVDLAVRLLERNGIRVASGRVDAAAALEAALADPRWDLVIIDFTLPGYSGNQAIAACRRLAPATPCLLVTGTLTLAEAAEAVTLGVVDFFTKDDLGRLPRAVRREVEHSRSLRAALADRQAADDRVRASEARFRAIFQSIGLPIVIVSRERKILSANPALLEYLGYTAADLTKLPLDSLLHPEDRGRPVEEQLSDESRCTWTADRRYLRKDGRVVWGHVTSSRLASESGDALISVIQDLTDRHRADEAVRESQLKSQFLAHMSHELRTPLNGILGFAQLLADSKMGALSSKQERYRVNIESSGQQLLRLITEVLDFSRIESGELQLVIGDVDLQELVAQCVEDVRPLVDVAGLNLVVDVGPSLTARSDRLRLKQVLLNILSNSIKFTPAGGRLTISADALPDEVRLCIADTGIGFSSEKHESVFHEFTQLDSGNKRTVGGAGLGLALAKRLVKMMAGDISVASRPGVGTLFTVSLPRGAGVRSGSGKERLARANKLAYEDVVTRLPNRRAFDAAWARDAARAQRHHHPLALALVDIDHFKDLNDHHGHAGGDAVLARLASALTATIRSGDMAARIGGDEFAVILPHTDEAGAVEWGRRIKASLLVGAEEVDFTISIGVAATPEVPADQLREMADRALYRAKGRGRNRLELIEDLARSRK